LAETEELSLRTPATTEWPT